MLIPLRVHLHICRCASAHTRTYAYIDMYTYLDGQAGRQKESVHVLGELAPLVFCGPFRIVRLVVLFLLVECLVCGL